MKGIPPHRSCPIRSATGAAVLSALGMEGAVGYEELTRAAAHPMNPPPGPFRGGTGGTRRGPGRAPGGPSTWSQLV